MRASFLSHILVQAMHKQPVKINAFLELHYKRSVLKAQERNRTAPEVGQIPESLLKNGG